MIRVLTLIAAFAALTAIAVEERSPLEKFNGKGLIGFEIELSASKFGNIVEHFEIPEGKRKTLPAFFPSEILDDYLLREENFHRLPDDLKSRLTGGKELKNADLELKESRIIIPGASQAASESRILIPGQKKAESASSIQFEEKKIEIPRQRFGKEDERFVIGQTPVRSQPNSITLSELNEAWNRLPLEIKRKAFNPNHLPRTQRAKFFTYFYEFVRLKRDAPSHLKGLDWIPDLNSLEFRHSQPMANFQEFWQQLIAFSKATGIERSILTPQSVARMDTSLHIHISFPGRDFSTFAQALSQSIGIKILATGDRSVLRADFGGMGDIESRASLVRLIAPDRIELRRLAGNLEVELPEILTLMTEANSEVAIGKLRKGVDAILTPNLLAELLELDPTRLSLILEGTKFGGISTAIQNSVGAAERKTAIYSELDRLGLAGQPRFGADSLWLLKQTSFTFDGAMDIQLLGEILLRDPGWSEAMYRLPNLTSQQLSQPRMQEYFKKTISGDPALMRPLFWLQMHKNYLSKENVIALSKRLSDLPDDYRGVALHMIAANKVPAHLIEEGLLRALPLNSDFTSAILEEMSTMDKLSVTGQELALKALMTSKEDGYASIADFIVEKMHANEGVPSQFKRTLIRTFEAAPEGEKFRVLRVISALAYRDAELKSFLERVESSKTCAQVIKATLREAL